MFPVVPLSEQLLGLADHYSRWLAAGQTILCHLYGNNFTPTPQSGLGDYTEILVGDFPGYAPIQLTQSGTPYINPQGNAEQVQSDPVFQPSADPVAPVTVYGYFVTLHPVAGPDTLLFGVRLDNPVVISSATQAVALDPDISQVAFSSPFTQ